MSKPETRSVVPPCPACGNPLGLYYAECLTCYAHAGDYSLTDYLHTGEGAGPGAGANRTDTL